MGSNGPGGGGGAGGPTKTTPPPPTLYTNPARREPFDRGNHRFGFPCVFLPDEQKCGFRDPDGVSERRARNVRVDQRTRGPQPIQGRERKKKLGTVVHQDRYDVALTNPEVLKKSSGPVHLRVNLGPGIGLILEKDPGTIAVSGCALLEQARRAPRGARAKAWEKRKNPAHQAGLNPAGAERANRGGHGEVPLAQERVNDGPSRAPRRPPPDSPAPPSCSPPRPRPSRHSNLPARINSRPIRGNSGPNSTNCGFQPPVGYGWAPVSAVAQGAAEFARPPSPGRIRRARVHLGTASAPGPAHTQTRPIGLAADHTHKHRHTPTHTDTHTDG